MNHLRRTLLQGGTALMLSPKLLAQSYPSKPINFIVPQPAGGDADAFCRLLQGAMQEYLGQPLVIDNRGGAAGNIGTAAGAKALADGHTLTFVNQGTMAFNPHLYANPGYSVEQLAPVSHLASVDLIICVYPSVKANNLSELIGLARKSPGSINYGSAGSGSANHLAGEMLKRMAGIDLTHVPFKGGGAAIASALGGQIESIVAFPLAVLPHIRAGKLRALAVTGAQRSQALPEVPTVAESGVKGYEFSSWFGLVLPQHTPTQIIQKINAAALHALKNPLTIERLNAGLTRAVGSTPAEFAQLIQRENLEWSKLIKQLNIKLD
ncbi:MAG: hypothetical protein RLZZ502_1339 [Pseudomonadota bacterium]|jgi:tripartite-type tricarboxylate transporter receptor subunit TctC